MTDPHPDDGALSAHLDGEEPRLRDHIEGCSSCALRLDQLRQVRAAVATPVPAPLAWQRDAAIVRALRATVDEHAEPRHRGVATRSAGIAAALLLVIGAAFAITQLSDSSPKRGQLASGGAPAENGSDAPAAAPSAGVARDLGDLGDLGELADSAALRAIVAPRAAEFALDRAAGANQETAPSPAPAVGTAQERAEKQVLARLSCAGSTRALDPKNVGPTHAGTATWQGTPAAVLVYSVQGQEGALHVYVVAQADCRVLEFQSYAP